jgi:hypothetical protein
MSEEEIERRKQEHQCIRCGMKSHCTMNCPFQPATRPLNYRPKVSAMDLSKTQLKDEPLHLEDSSVRKV